MLSSLSSVIKILLLQPKADYIQLSGSGCTFTNKPEMMNVCLLNQKTKLL